jgi:hypothetical protein
MMWTSKSSSFSSIVSTKPGKLARSCVCSVFIVPKARDHEQQVHLALAARRLDRPEVVVGPDVAEHARARCSALPGPAESSAVPVDDVSPLVELPLVDAGRAS